MPVFTLAEIAEKIGGELDGDPNLQLRGIAEIDKAEPGEITFLANPKYRHFVETTQASAIIIKQEFSGKRKLPAIKMRDPYYGFLQVVKLFHPPRPLQEKGVHPAAVIDDSAELGEDVSVGANVYIGAGVKIGRRTQILPNCVILENSEIGEDCLLYPLVSIRENCKIGNRVILHNGVVIGSDGFGFAPHDGKFVKILQVGNVVLEDDVEIGANSTIDRAALGTTLIKRGTKLDNLVQIAHNVTIGEDSVIAAQTGISGSTKVGKNAMFGGQVGLVGHLTIGDRVRIGAQTGVTKSFPDDTDLLGYPARPMMLEKRIEILLPSLPDLVKKVRKLEKQLKLLQEKNPSQ